MHIFDNQPTVEFFCEQCRIGFDIEGTLERADGDGGMVFIPGYLVMPDVYCPNDLGYEFGERPVHELSIGGG